MLANSMQEILLTFMVLAAPSLAFVVPFSAPLNVVVASPFSLKVRPEETRTRHKSELDSQSPYSHFLTCATNRLNTLILPALLTIVG